MDLHPYWKQQSSDMPLYPDIEWNKPERRDQAGRLGIVGGNKLGFAGVAEAYSTALNEGIGVVRVLLPDVLKKTIPSTMADVVFSASTISGGLSKDATTDLVALGNWANGVLLIGDAGRNSETAIAYELFLEAYQGQAVLTRDAVDLVKNNPKLLVERDKTLLVVSFAQLQKIFQSVYYPKILTFSIQLGLLVEAVHKFTITYPVNLMVLHKDYLVVASGGEVTSTPWENPMAIWRGQVAARVAAYWLWSPDQPLEAATASIVVGNSSKSA